MLLFPGRESEELGHLPAGETPAPLVLVDATWAQASHMVRHTPWLRELPRVGITPTAPSEFRVRRPPAPHCLSTIEAVCQSLRVLEPRTDGPDALLAVFREMVSRQETFLAEHGHDARYHQKRPSRAIPDALRADPSQIVLCLAEGVRLSAGSDDSSDSGGSAGSGDPGDSGDRRALCIATRRLDGSDERLWIHRHLGEVPTTCHLERIGITRGQVRDGLDALTFSRAIAAHIRSDDVLVTWTEDSFRLLPESKERARIAIRHLVRRAHPDKRGDLFEVADAFGMIADSSRPNTTSGVRPVLGLDPLARMATLLRETKTRPGPT